ncbi:MAG TPA: hypothetical protein VGG86_19715 [Roseiarcus sp.]
MSELTVEQQAIFDAEIESLRKRLERRKAVIDLPSLKQRADALKSLRVAIERVRTAAAVEPLQVAGPFSPETDDWLAEARAVADELRELAKPPSDPGLARGMKRPNEYRQWLIGEQIPALCEKVYGKRFSVTIGGWAMGFAHHVLKVLGEKDDGEQTIKSLVSSVRREVRTKKTRM